MSRKTLSLRLAICGGALPAPACFGLPMQSSHAAVVFTTDFDSVPVPPGSFITSFVPVEGWNPGTNGIELQNHAAGTPFSEPNLVELDTFANSSMSRTISAPGHYVLQWHYSPRPGVAANSNGIEVLLNGAGIQTVAQDGTGNPDTVWTLQTVAFDVGALPATLEFAAIGISDSLGGYIDSVTLFVPE